MGDGEREIWTKGGSWLVGDGEREIWTKGGSWLVGDGEREGDKGRKETP